jgi:hypothetical protein
MSTLDKLAGRLWQLVWKEAFKRLLFVRKHPSLKELYPERWNCLEITMYPVTIVVEIAQSVENS